MANPRWEYLKSIMAAILWASPQPVGAESGLHGPFSLTRMGAGVSFPRDSWPGPALRGTTPYFFALDGTESGQHSRAPSPDVRR